MSKLQLTPPLVIITMGYPGSGKTFFSRQFSDQYDLPRISEDRIRFELFEAPSFSKEEASIISRIQMSQLEEVMKTKSTIIYEGSSDSKLQRKAIKEFAAKGGYRTLTVWLQTDLATSSFRASSRDRRNPDNKHSFPIGNEIFEKQVAKLNRPDEREDFVVISGKHAYKNQSLTVLKKITNMYSEALSKTARPAPQPGRPAKRILM